jgi:methionyl-tRNA formyltransferase
VQHFKKEVGDCINFGNGMISILNMKKIIFLGSKPIGYACLQYLIAQQKKLNFEIIGVLTNDNTKFNPEQSVKALAKKNKIKLIPSLAKMPACDILYSVQYHEILKATHIAKAKQIAVNLHMAPLPDYRGCNQFSFAIIDKAKEFGTTIHQLEVGIDNGAILFEDRFHLPKKTWVKDLYEETERRSIELFQDTLKSIVNADYKPKPQAKFKKRKSSFHLRKEINDIKKIDLNWGKEKIERYIRATYFPPFEPPYFEMNGKKISWVVE